MKAVIILEPNQPLGLLVNTASILSITLGDLCGDIRGVDTIDKDGTKHLGVIKAPLPILQADKETLKYIYKKALDSNLVVADFTKVAQSCKSYDEYIKISKKYSTLDMGILGIALYGNKKEINKLVGNLKVLRWVSH